MKLNEFLASFACAALWDGGSRQGMHLSLFRTPCALCAGALSASGWGDLIPGDFLPARAQGGLREAGHAPESVAVKSRWLMLASAFPPFLHLSDHPAADRDPMRLQMSLPSTVEAFLRQRLPARTRIEFCHAARQVVVHRGWTPIPPNCLATDGDRVVGLD
ncbi:MAG: DUF2145 domain-containing protein [Massilia sp.]